MSQLPLQFPDGRYLDTPRFTVELRLRHADTVGESIVLDRPEAVANYLFRRLRVHENPQEQMIALYCDTRQRLIGTYLAHQGTLNRTAVEPRGIFQAALLLNAATFFLSHNHPSGDPAPSVEDLAFTRRIAESAELVGLRLLDHLVTGKLDRYVALQGRINR